MCKPLAFLIFSSHRTNPSVRSSRILLTQVAPDHSSSINQPFYGPALNRWLI